jgi:hypothetical protein
MSAKSNQMNCPEGKYWVHPYKRKVIGKNGKPYIQEVKGYCSNYRSPFHRIADEENLPLDFIYFALTIYGESRNQNDTSRRVIAWIIRNRFEKAGSKSYQRVVLRRTQFSCWMKSDPNYEKMEHPGEEGPADKRAWQKIKIIAKEVGYASKKENPIPGIYHYFSGRPKKK